MKFDGDISFGSVLVGVFIGVVFMGMMWVISDNTEKQKNHTCRFSTYYAQHEGRSK